MQPSPVDSSVKPIERLAKVIRRTPRQRGCTVSSDIFCRFSVVEVMRCPGAPSSFLLRVVLEFSLCFSSPLFLHLPEWIDVKVETLVGPGPA